jgi:hypothetical protein
MAEKMSEKKSDEAQREKKRLAAFNREKFQSEVARELGIDLSSMDEIKKPGQDQQHSSD